MSVESLIVFVCHANVCRSPMAERLSRLAVESSCALRAGGLVVASAGTHARPGAPMHAGAARVLAELGADGTGFVSRSLVGSTVEGACLVLTATRSQRAMVVSLAPGVLRRTFTLRQFGRLAGLVDPRAMQGVALERRLDALVGEVVRVRGGQQPVAACDDELADPVNGTMDDVRACASAIQCCLEPVWAILSAA